MPEGPQSCPLGDFPSFLGATSLPLLSLLELLLLLVSVGRFMHCDMGLEVESDFLIWRRELSKHGFARKEEFGIQYIIKLFKGNEGMTTFIVICMVFPLQYYISSRTLPCNSSNSQLKVTKSWDGSIFELLAFRSFSKLNFIVLP